MRRAAAALAVMLALSTTFFAIPLGALGARAIIAALILTVCAIGAYTVSNAEFDIVLMLVFGVVGYVMKKLDYPLAPLVLALVLGDRTEEAFRQSLLISEGSMGVFFSNWLVSTIMTLGIVLLLWPLFAWLRGLLQGGGLRRPRPA